MWRALLLLLPVERERTVKELLEHSSDVKESPLHVKEPQPDHPPDVEALDARLPRLYPPTEAVQRPRPEREPCLVPAREPLCCLAEWVQPSWRLLPLEL